MDLAMPDMDGWQTIRRIRASGLSECEIAIISANAFERGAENEVGITAENFITKPVRLYDLVDWIGRHLRLEWVTAAETPDTERAPVPLVLMIYPPHAQLQRLLVHVERGYIRGVATQLGEIEALDPRYEGFVTAMRRLSGQFQFDAMKTLLKAGLGKEEAHHA
jgi:CheY-like chemotaxis protein